MSQPDPTEPTPNDDKFKPQNVAGELADRSPTERRGAPADTEGYDIEQGSSGVTKETPSA